jgi:hypothetical protein
MTTLPPAQAFLTAVFSIFTGNLPTRRAARPLPTTRVGTHYPGGSLGKGYPCISNRPPVDWAALQGFRAIARVWTAGDFEPLFHHRAAFQNKIAFVSGIL